MQIRPARTSDVRTIRALIDEYAPDRRLLSKATVALYEDVTDFFVADDDGAIVGCGALHVMWEDLAEVRTLAVLPHMMRRGSVHRCSPPWSDGPRTWGQPGFLPDLRAGSSPRSASRSSTNGVSRPGFAKSCCNRSMRGRGVPGLGSGPAQHLGQHQDGPGTQAVPAQSRRRSQAAGSSTAK